ncbi:hypothetical protein [Sphaerisporangium rufum]|uniref:hypothetical protein n=1 Tax=Sphaerisporangium rufum TaxID=1381558 RepID=UPI00195060BB|nr:hypothetical protein [Sphaerisporangium rufum]
MSEIPGAAAGPGDQIAPALLRCGTERFSGVLRIGGGPGGDVHLRDGLVIAATTPAAPGPESVLLRATGVSEEAWSQAYRAGAPAGELGAALVAERAVGAAGLEVICLTALFDALFAMVASGAYRCTAEPAGPGDLSPALPVSPGITPDRLVRETRRRLAAAAPWRDLGVTPRARPLATRPADPAAPRPDELRHAVLRLANGRRTVRDIAFALGRGLFPVMGEAAHMVAAGLLTLAPADAETGPVPLPGEGAAPAGPARAAPVPDGGLLPRRRRGASGAGQIPPPPAAGPPPAARSLAVRDIRTAAAHEEQP